MKNKLSSFLKNVKIKLGYFFIDVTIKCTSLKWKIRKLFNRDNLLTCTYDEGEQIFYVSSEEFPEYKEKYFKIEKTISDCFNDTNPENDAKIIEYLKSIKKSEIFINDYIKIRGKYRQFLAIDTSNFFDEYDKFTKDYDELKDTVEMEVRFSEIEKLNAEYSEPLNKKKVIERINKTKKEDKEILDRYLESKSLDSICANAVKIMNKLEN